MVTSELDAPAFARFVAAELERWGPAARASLAKN
jgi:hypothetical protein